MTLVHKVNAAKEPIGIAKKWQYFDICDICLFFRTGFTPHLLLNVF